MKISKRKIETKKLKPSLQLKLVFQEQKELKPKTKISSKAKSFRNELLKEALKECVKLAIKALYENLLHLLNMLKDLLAGSFV